MLIVDGTDPELVKNILETEISYMEGRHSEGKSMLDTLGSLGPAFGMIGTLIGLVAMLKNLDDPSSIGPSMAVALITTFYGSVIANLIFIPMSNKVSLKSKEEVLVREIMVEGLLSIQAGENPESSKRSSRRSCLPVSGRQGLLKPLRRRHEQREKAGRTQGWIAGMAGYLWRPGDAADVLLRFAVCVLQHRRTEI